MIGKQLDPRKQFVINVSSNLGLFLINFLVGIWLVPYLISHLGIASYGMIPLATTATSYLGLLTLSLNGAVGRFLMIDLNQQMFPSANRVFNTALFASLGLSAIVLLLSVGIVLSIPYVLNIPAGQTVATQLLFATVMLAFAIMTVESSFSVSSWVRNRFDIDNAVAAVSRVLQIAVIVTAFTVLGPQLYHVGFGALAAAVVALLGAVIYWRRLTPQLHIDLKEFDRGRLRDLTGMSLWMTINHIGSILFLSTDLLIVNRFFGAEISGQYGAILQISVYLRTFASLLSGVLAPTIVAKYSRDDWDGMNRISRQAVKLLGMIVALPIGLLCGFARPFIAIWLGQSFLGLAPLLIILTIHLCINLAALPLFDIQIAFNKVRLPAIVTFAFGLVNIAFAMGMALWGGWGAIGIAVAGMVMLTLKNSVFTSIYSAVIQKSPWWVFLSSLFYGVLGTMIVGLAAYAISQVLVISSWISLMAVSLPICILYGVVAYLFGLKQEERVLLRTILNLKLRTTQLTEGG